MPDDTIPTSEPTELIAGDNWSWDRTVTGRSPSDGWALTYYFRGPSVFTINAGGDAGVFELRAQGVNTMHPPGLYRVVGRVWKQGDRFTVFESMVAVHPDPAAGLSFAERMVARIEAELEARFGSGQNVRRWEQGGRSEELAEEQELRKQLGFYREQVRVERGGPLFVPVNAEFGRS